MTGLALLALSPSVAACTVSTTPLGFGSINPLDGNAYTSTSTVAVTCPSSTSFDVWVSAGASGDVSQRHLSSAEHTLKYNLYRDSSYSQIWGDGTGAGVIWSATATEATATVYGRVPHQPTAYPGSYSDLLTVTVSF